MFQIGCVLQDAMIKDSVFQMVRKEKKKEVKENKHE